MGPRFEALCARFGLRTEYFVLEVGSAPEGLEPRFMANRKLKLRPARFAVLPVWDHVTSVGLILQVMLVRLAKASPGGTLSDEQLLFPEVDATTGRPLRAPVSGARFLARLKRTAEFCGMSSSDRKMLHCRSLRAGGCTDFFANGVSKVAIKGQGGWTSDTVEIYNRPSAFQKWSSFCQFVPGFLGIAKVHQHF